ncbi:MAG: pilus assembly protein [Alphaproteobacteria bacterium]|nr:pilus assembly protein [Alphaproteobacteria bacterium]
MIKAFVKFGKREDGSALIEAALGLPILLATIIGVLEIANFYFVTATMENAVLHASRFGVTGSFDEGSSRETQLLEVIEEQTYGWVKMDEVSVETLVYETFGDIGEEEPYSDDNGSGTYDPGEDYSDVNGNGQWDSDMAVAGLGDAGDIVFYRISYPAPSLTGFGDWMGKTINITSTVAVRNEPF